MPAPELAALTSDSAFYDLMFAKAEDGSYVWTGEVVVDSSEELDISIFSPFEQQLDVIVQPPDEVPFSLKLAEMSRSHLESVGIPYNPHFTKVCALMKWVCCL